MPSRKLRKCRQEAVESFRELSGRRGHRAHLPRFYWSLYCVLFELFKRVVMKTQILHSLAVNVTPAAACLGLTPPVGNQQECLGPYLLSGKNTKKREASKTENTCATSSAPWSWFWKNLASCSLSPQKTENGDCTGSRWCEVLVLCLALRKHDREKISPGVSESKGEEQDDEGHFPTLTTASLEKVTANRSFRYFFSNGQLSASPTGPENLYSQFSKIGCNLFWLLKADENWL